MSAVKWLSAWPVEPEVPVPVPAGPVSEHPLQCPGRQNRWSFLPAKYLSLFEQKRYLPVCLMILESRMYLIWTRLETSPSLTQRPHRMVREPGQSPEASWVTALVHLADPKHCPGKE